MKNKTKYKKNKTMMSLIIGGVISIQKVILIL